MSRSLKLLQVKDAAELLGVSANTIRNWTKGGVLPELRHPVNGYRLFRQKDLLKVKRQLDRIREV